MLLAEKDLSVSLNKKISCNHQFSCMNVFIQKTTTTCSSKLTSAAKISYECYMDMETIPNTHTVIVIFSCTIPNQLLIMPTDTQNTDTNLKYRHRPTTNRHSFEKLLKHIFVVDQCYCIYNTSKKINITHSIENYGHLKKS